MTCEYLPWPRLADDGVTPLGIDLAARMVGSPPRPDPTARTGQTAAAAARALVLWMVEKRPLPRRARIDADDLVQRVLETLLRRNHQPSAYDPRLASFSKYVLVVARSVALNMLAPARRDARIALLDELPDVPAEGDPHAALEAALEARRAQAVVQTALPWGAEEEREAQPKRHARGRAPVPHLIRVGKRWWDGERLRKDPGDARGLARAVADAAAGELRASGVADVEVVPASSVAQAPKQKRERRPQLDLWSDRDLDEVAARFAA